MTETSPANSTPDSPIIQLSSALMSGSYFQESCMTWQPSQPASYSNTEAFIQFVNTRHGLGLSKSKSWSPKGICYVVNDGPEILLSNPESYEDIHRYSVEDYAFWEDLWSFLDIRHSVPPSKVYEPTENAAFHTWFPGAKLNYAENLLSRRGPDIACTTTNELGRTEHITWNELHEIVRQFAVALRTNGLQTGDRVAAIISNRLHALAIALAAISIGAIYSSTATDMGLGGILDRYRQIQPKFIFADIEVQYNGKVVDLREKVAGVMEDTKMQGVVKCILLPSAVTGRESDNFKIHNSTTLSSFLREGDDGRVLQFEQLPFDHPAFILYSSGTSGPPKCIVHSGCSALIHGKKDMVMAYNLTKQDTYFQYTTTGWMMWTHMITALSIGTRIIIYDGSPFYPDIRRFLRYIDDERVTFFGTSPRFLAEVKGRGISPSTLGRFENLRAMSVTGAILTPVVYEWTQKAFSDDRNGRYIFIISMSGGTDVCAGFIGGNPSLPTFAGEIQCKSLGMAVTVMSAPPERHNLEESGEPGELVITRPHPSIPRFWGDDEKRTKMYATYFGDYDVGHTGNPIWRQGDFIVKNPETKGFVHLGRSDGVLNPSGVRFGSAEIYSILESPPFNDWIEDCLCIGQQRLSIDQHERVLLFIKMRPGEQGRLTTQRRREVSRAIKEQRSARHIPAGIWEVRDIPYTVNGKKIEIAVKNIVSGRGIKNSGTVANPESLEEYVKFQDVEKYLPREKTKL